MMCNTRLVKFERKMTVSLLCDTEKEMNKMIPTKKIAVVDDSSLSRDFVKTALESLPWAEVVTYEDGQMAWEALRNSDSADIVLTDIKMPRMNGLELLKRVKAKEPQKPCVLMSATPEYVNIATMLQADGFLLKPFELTELFTLVESFALIHDDLAWSRAS